MGKLYSLFIEFKFSFIGKLNTIFIKSLLLIKVNSILSIIIELNKIIKINLNVMLINKLNEKLNISFEATDVT